MRELALVQNEITTVYDLAGKGALLTFDWSTARDTSLPDLYTATGIFEAGLGVRRATDLTLNVVTSFYKNRPAMAERAFKSFEASAQVDHPLGNVLYLSSVSVTIAAKYSYLPKDTVASAPSAGSGANPAAPSATAAVAPKGHIALVQAKLTLPIKNTGMKVPLSITASNRTELIKEKDVRASVGITFDLDTFLTAWSANAK